MAVFFGEVSEVVMHSRLNSILGLLFPDFFVKFPVGLLLDGLCKHRFSRCAPHGSELRTVSLASSDLLKILTGVFTGFQDGVN